MARSCRSRKVRIELGRKMVDEGGTEVIIMGSASVAGY